MEDKEKGVERHPAGQLSSSEASSLSQGGCDQLACPFNLILFIFWQE